MNDPKEIVVVGAGAAGMAASITLARRGAKVALLENRDTLGGIVAHGLIHTIGGLYDSQANLINEGLPVELVKRLSSSDANTRKRKIGRVWVLKVCPTVYKKTAKKWIQEERNINIFFQTTDIRVAVQKDRIFSVEFFCQGQKRTVQPKALIDCTGEANIIESIDPNLILSDGNQALAGYIFRMRNVKVEELKFPKNIAVQQKIRRAVDEGLLPVECAKVWLDTGVYDDEIYVKLSILRHQHVLDSHVGQRIEKAQHQLTAFLSKLPSFAHSRVVQSGQLCFRDGNRAKGEYQLTVDDVRSLRKFKDMACRCSWPIEYWDPVKGVEIEYLKNDDHYDIPLRSLKVVGLKNAWVAGKCFSSDYLAQASARVAGCCWAMGEAAGNAVLCEKI